MRAKPAGWRILLDDYRAELVWPVESPARSQDRHYDESTLYVALGSDKRALGKMTCRKRRGNSWRRRSMGAVA
jgi:hypothetical protein